MRPNGPAMQRVRAVGSFVAGIAIIAAGLWAGVHGDLPAWAVVALVVLGLFFAFPKRARALYTLVKDRLPKPRGDL
ncbi:hypothetical protein [Candidatus Palauibacter sp.]|uniref:hypothetical protein n=1 Tax=Candidatus Palauibacter sp. TaxID=3101350 RepID=UPI003CC5167B